MLPWRCFAHDQFRSHKVSGALLEHLRTAVCHYTKSAGLSGNTSGWKIPGCSGGLI